MVELLKVKKTRVCNVQFKVSPTVASWEEGLSYFMCHHSPQRVRVALLCQLKLVKIGTMVQLHVFLSFANLVSSGPDTR
jgi:hypothetical protein